MRRVLAITSVVGVAAALVFAAVRAAPVGSTAARPGGAQPSSAASTATAAKDAYAALPPRFEPNLGQADQRVRFLSRGQGYTLLMTRTGARLRDRLGVGELSSGEVASVQASLPSSPVLP